MIHEPLDADAQSRWKTWLSLESFMATPTLEEMTGKTLTISDAIEILQGLMAHSGPDAPLTVNNTSVDCSDFCALV